VRLQNDSCRLEAPYRVCIRLPIARDTAQMKTGLPRKAAGRHGDFLRSDKSRG